MTRLLFIVISSIIFFASHGLAQEDKVAVSASSLGNALFTLKQSVDKLGVDNDQLAARDNALKQRILQLQMQLRQLESQGDVLNKAKDKLGDQNPDRARKIERLKAENTDLDDRIQQAQAAVQSIQQAPSPETLAADHGQKEKLRLMKMIYDSQQRQEALHQSILEFQKNAPARPAAGAMARRQVLNEQIKALEDQITARQQNEKPSLNDDHDNQWNDAQLRQLEAQLTVLERNYSQLKILMGQMSKRNQSAALTVNKRVEVEKLQADVDDLHRQALGLKADLDDLRLQMIDLDKRKFRLENMIGHPSQG